MEINAAQVDERDSRWEDGAPRFRVYLHADPGGDATDTYDLTGADVLQAIDWAQSRVGQHGTYAIALVRDRPGPAGPERGLVWLVGIDGNTNPSNETDVDSLRRMVERSASPVGVPSADRID